MFLFRCKRLQRPENGGEIRINPIFLITGGTGSFGDAVLYRSLETDIAVKTNVLAPPAMAITVGSPKILRLVADYVMKKLSGKIVRTTLSYNDYVRRTVGKEP